MPLDEAFLRRLRATFDAEAQEHIEAMNRLVVDLERDEAPQRRSDLLEEIFREAHSLKGAARAVGLDAVETMAHDLESLLSNARAGKAALSPDVFSRIYETLDRIAEGVGTASKPTSRVGVSRPPSAKERTAAPSGPASKRVDQAHSAHISGVVGGDPAGTNEAKAGGATVRVLASRLDALMAQAGEVVVARMGAEQLGGELRELLELVDHWHRDWRVVRSSVNKHPRNGEPAAPTAEIRAFLQRNERRLRELGERLRLVIGRFNAEARHMAQVSGGLEDEVKNIRLRPLSTVFASVPRMVRDLANEQQKEVALRMIGADTEVDMAVAELLKDPLVHLVRNCLDHGIESPDEREAQGKPREATITVEAAAEGGTVRLTVSDDGKGIDREAVREAALRSGDVLAEELTVMDDEAVLGLIFRPGLSTSAMVTELSGRGVGLDVVRQNVERLHGRIEVQSYPGKGTQFTAILPVTVTTTQSLLVKAAGHTFAIPLASVEQVIRVPQDQPQALVGQRVVRLGSRPVVLLPLEDVLSLQRDEERPQQTTLTAVVVAAGEQRAGFLVDHLVGEQEIVVKNLGSQLPRVRHVAGGAILGTGEVVMVLNAGDLLKSVQRAETRGIPATVQPEGGRQRRTILVVDDSITTRTLEKTILEAAGYDVRVARDGAEAWSQLQTDGCDLVVTDVMMPEMDGFELTRRLRSDEARKHLPVILVTSLESRTDKERGVEVGADAYIVKSAFDQDALLETIRRLL